MAPFTGPGRSLRSERHVARAPAILPQPPPRQGATRLSARFKVERFIGDADPLVTVRETLEREPFDAVIVSTLAARASHWLHRDLPLRVEQLGVPVTVVTAKASSRRLPAER